jgi:hypothetical protein
MTITFLAPDGVEISAQRFRQARAALYGGGANRRLGGRSGFRVDTPSNILTATSTTWTLGPCAAMIDPGATTHQGMYGWATDANVTGTVTAADSTNPRKDIVYIQINDSTAGDGSGAVTAEVLYLAGTPAPVGAGTPAAPTLPARSFLVGTISVPVSGGGSPTVVRNPAVFVAAGAVVPINDSTELSALTPYEGMRIQRMDRGGYPVYVYYSGVWRRESPGLVAFNSNTSTSVGIVGTEVVADSVNNVALVKGHKYEINYDLSTAAGNASQAFALTVKKSLTSDTGTTGTTLVARTYWTAPVSGSGDASQIRAYYTPVADEDARFLVTIQRLTGAGGIDIEKRVLAVEDKGYLP